MPQSTSTLILIALMVVAFYFLILRPSRKRQQAQQQTMNALEPGARVVTGSGFYGTVVAIGPKQIVMEISPGAELTVLKQAVVRVVPAGEEDEGLHDYLDEPDDRVLSDPGSAGSAGSADNAVSGEIADPYPSTESGFERPDGERPRDNA